MKDPAFLFYSDNFMSGTMFFTDEQVGKYVRLLCAQHLTGHLQENHMIFICKKYDEDIWKKFIRDDDGKFYNERLEIEINKRKKYAESRSNNKKGKSKLPKKPKKSYDFHMGNEIGNEIEVLINELKLDENFKIVISKWLKYKSEKGQKYKKLGMEGMIKKLVKLSGSDSKKAELIINDAISNNYAGFFELKQNEKNRRTNGFHSPETNEAIAATERIFAEYGQGNAFTHSNG